MRMVVVLPAPFGPRNAKTSPRSHREADLIDGDQVAESLGQAFDQHGVLPGWPIVVTLHVGEHRRPRLRLSRRRR